MQEDQIIAGLRARDRNTTEYVYKKYAWALYATVTKIISDQELAEVVFHDSFIKIILTINEYDKSNNRLYIWMADICRNNAVEKIRSKDISQSV